tara:strand:+ start:221 stop:556 length:336 start_codon:yes stop_codon:yes gene_type:complete
MQQVELKEIKQQLSVKRDELEARISKIEESKKRKEPLSADSGEQSLELENNEVVDALDQQERNDLVLIKNALSKIEAGGYGTCVSCGEEIGLSRLKALPFTPVCLSCAQEA